MEETAIISEDTMSQEYSFAEYEKEAITTRMYPDKFLIIYPTIKLNAIRIVCFLMKIKSKSKKKLVTVFGI